MVKAAEWLKTQKEIKEVFEKGKSVYYTDLKLLYKNNEYSYNRIVITAKSGFKNAVIRNRQRRIIKEIWRAIKGKIKPGYDIVIIVFPGDKTYRDREDQVGRLFKIAGLLVN